MGMGRIGEEVARIALGLGMRVIAADNNVGRASIKVKFYNNQFINVDIETEPLQDVLKTFRLHYSARSCTEGRLYDRKE